MSEESEETTTLRFIDEEEEDEEDEDGENEINTLSEHIDNIEDLAASYRRFYPRSMTESPNYMVNQNYVSEKYERFKSDLVESFEWSNLSPTHQRFLDFIKNLVLPSIACYQFDIQNIRNHVVTAELLWHRLLKNIKTDVSTLIYDVNFLRSFLDTEVTTKEIMYHSNRETPRECEICSEKPANFVPWGCSCNDVNTCFDCFFQAVSKGETFWSQETIRCLFCRCEIDLHRSVVLYFKDKSKKRPLPPKKEKKEEPAAVVVDMEEEKKIEKRFNDKMKTIKVKKTT